MFRVAAIILLVVNVWAINSASAGLIVYNGSIGDARSDWESDVGLFNVEGFADATLFPGVSVVSDNGSVSGGVWSDQITTTATTTWTFDTPVEAWGADFNLAIPGGLGGGVTMAVIYADSTTEVVGNIPTTHGLLVSDFYGFTSDKSVSQVVLSNTTSATELLSLTIVESYNLDQMSFKSISVVPEPSLFALLSFLAVGCGGFIRRRRPVRV